MAACAILAEYTSVNVITFVAGNACIWRGHLLSVFHLVAAVAMGAFMGPRKPKLSLTVVIEAPLFPICRHVAARASSTEAPTVMAILMAAFALARCVFKGARFMAGLAFDVDMAAKQWKPRQFMVE